MDTNLMDTGARVYATAESDKFFIGKTWKILHVINVSYQCIGTKYVIKNILGPDLRNGSAFHFTNYNYNLPRGTSASMMRKLSLLLEINISDHFELL